jgi:DNA-binding Xre family transcriptional regulator
MIRLNIGSYLEQKNITPYRLVKESGLAPNTVYNLARTPAKRIDLDTLGSIVEALTRLTGKTVTPNDLLEVIEEPPQEIESETRAWLDGAAYDMGKALDELEKDIPRAELEAWLEANRKSAKPAKYIAGQGIVLLEGVA